MANTGTKKKCPLSRHSMPLARPPRKTPGGEPVPFSRFRRELSSGGTNACGDATCIYAPAQRLLLRVRVVPFFEFGVGGRHLAAAALEQVYEPKNGVPLRTNAIDYFQPCHYDPLSPSSRDLGGAAATTASAAVGEADAGDDAVI